MYMATETNTAIDYVTLLKDHLASKQEKNPLYSIRALARDINIDPSDLINILNRKKQMTTKIAYKIGIYFAYDDKELLNFIRPTLK